MRDNKVLIKMQKVGFEPTPFRNRALIYRLRPLGHFYFLITKKLKIYLFVIGNLSKILFFTSLSRKCFQKSRILRVCNEKNVNDHFLSHQGSDSGIVLTIGCKVLEFFLDLRTGKSLDSNFFSFLDKEPKPVIPNFPRT